MGSPVLAPFGSLNPQSALDARLAALRVVEWLDDRAPMAITTAIAPTAVVPMRTHCDVRLRPPCAARRTASWPSSASQSWKVPCTTEEAEE